MYQEKRSGSRITLLLAALALVLLVGFGPLAGQIYADMGQQSTQSVRDSVLRCAVQCYAVEGAYPPSLEYLEEHYGLVLNGKRYIVSYEAYASNLAPEVRVLVRGG